MGMKRELDAKSRRLLVIANALLVLGISMMTLATAAPEHLRPAIHAVMGFFMGLSITMNLHLIWRTRHRRAGDGGDGSGCGGTQAL